MLHPAAAPTGRCSRAGEGPARYGARRHQQAAVSSSSAEPERAVPSSRARVAPCTETEEARTASTRSVGPLVAPRWCRATLRQDIAGGPGTPGAEPLVERRQTQGGTPRATPAKDRWNRHRTTGDGGPGAPPPAGAWGPGPRGNATREPTSPATAGRAPTSESHPPQPAEQAALDPPEASRPEAMTNEPTPNRPSNSPPDHRRQGPGGAAPAWSLGARPQRKRDTPAGEPRHSRASTRPRKPPGPASPEPAGSQQSRDGDQHADPETDR